MTSNYICNILLILKNSILNTNIVKISYRKLSNFFFDMAILNSCLIKCE